MMPLQFFKEVSTWLNEKFNGRWIGRASSISWPPRSLDSTPLDFFLWRYIKTKVYKTRLNDIADIKERIKQEIEALKKETLENVFDGIVRLKFCIDVNGDTLEQ